MAFVEFKRYQGAPVFINPEQVTYVAGLADGKHSEISFGKDHTIVVAGDTKRVISQLASQQEQQPRQQGSAQPDERKAAPETALKLYSRA